MDQLNRTLCNTGCPSLPITNPNIITDPILQRIIIARRLNLISNRIGALTLDPIVDDIILLNRIRNLESDPLLEELLGSLN